MNGTKIGMRRRLREDGEKMRGEYGLYTMAGCHRVGFGSGKAAEAQNGNRCISTSSVHWRYIWVWL